MPSPNPIKAAAYYSRWWVRLWLLDVIALAAYAPFAPLGHWLAAFAVLFLLPEMIGLRVRGDALPPLTYVTRRYLPRWAPTALTFAAGVWLAILWQVSAFWVADAGFVGWLTNHWDVTYDGPGE
jgi:hypothetical protein